MVDFKSVVYATHDGVEIGLDYALPRNASEGKPAPILLWFHGGGEPSPSSYPTTHADS